MTCWKYCTWGWWLMKLAGFLFYFCQIQISSALKDEAMGPKFLRIKKRERRGRRRNKMLVKSSTLFGTTPHSTYILSGTPQSWMWLLFSCFSISHDSWIFSFFLKLTVTSSPPPLRFNLGPWGRGNRCFVLSLIPFRGCLWGPTPFGNHTALGVRSSC